MTSSTPTRDVTTVYQTRPIIGPLTTVFSAPQDCDFAFVQGTPLSVGFRAQTCIGDDLADETSCWPPATSAAPSASPPISGWGFYSPGISCPAGYTTACAATDGLRTGWNMQFTMERGETAVGCCPTGFSCSSVAFGQTCISTASEAVQTATCSGGNFVSVDFATFPIVDTSTNAESSSTATHSTLPIMAPMIQINWRSEDLMSATETVSTPSTPAGTGSGSSSSASISPGAVAGIVVAGVVSFFAITAFIFFWMRRRKARGNVNAGMTKDDMKLDQYGNPKGTELPSSHGRAELAAFRNPSELSGHQDPVELPTSPNNPPSYQN